MDRNKAPDTGGPLSNGFVWLAVLAAGTFFIHEAPLQGSRPMSQEPKLYRYVDNNRVDARLWQDPIGAAARGRDELRKVKGAGVNASASTEAKASPSTSAPNDVDILYKAFCTGKENDFLVLGVMVQGGPYPDYAEFRRRARYSVFAGLSSFGYAPEDQEHIRFFEPRNAGPPSSYENAPAGNAKPPTFPEFIAYEWLLESEEKPGPQGRTGPPKVLVLWLDEDYFGDKSLARADFLTRIVSGREECPSPNPGPERKLLILGPGDSGELKAMASEAVGRKEHANDKLAFYSYGATAEDKAILSKVTTPTGKISVSQFFANSHVSLLRTIASDEALAAQLSEELALRNIRPAEAWCAGKATTRLPELEDSLRTRPGAQHVVLIAEWDTVYGRTLPRTMARALSTTKGISQECRNSINIDDPPPWIRTFTYLRGLDGQRPAGKTGAGADTDTKSGTDSADKSVDNADRNQDKQIERSEGQSQLDYLRRLAIDLAAYNRKLQADGASIGAIGVLGSDVYDKLVVIQALNKHFPEAIFFTTDLDARLLHPKELDWTRNLIIASGYGLKLSPRLQLEIAPFRDSYETSLYLSTMIAMNNAQPDGCANSEGLLTVGCISDPKSIDQVTIDQWLRQPRVFEVGRHGAFDFSKGPPIAADAIASAEVNPPDCGSRQLSKCRYIHALPSPLFPHLRNVTLWLATALLFVGALALMIVTGHGHGVVAAIHSRIAAHDSVRQNLTRAAIVLLAMALAIVVFKSPALWAGVFGFLTQNGDGVPFTFTEGISLWPTELIRLIALLASCYFIYTGWRSLTRNAKLISGKFMWQTEEEALKAEAEARYKKWTGAEKIWHALSFRFPAQSNKGSGDLEGMEPAAADFWVEYIYRGRFRSRIVRVAVLTAFYFMSGAVLMSILGWPVSPTRGAVSYWLDKALIMLAVFAMLLLIFFVVDATVFACQMVLRLQAPLRNSQPGGGTVWRWPTSTLSRYEQELNVHFRHLDQWIGLRFIAERTSVVAPLIYYPFIVISLMIVSRSAVFANWNMPIGLILVISGSVIIVSGCAIWLRICAESARKKAIEDLTLETIRLNSAGGDDKQTAEQLDIMIAEIRGLRAGAFAPYSQQPFLTALLFPLGSFGGTALVEYLTMANL